MAAKKKDKKERDAADTHSLPDHTKEQLDLPLKGSPDLTGQSKEQLIHKLQDLQIHLEMQAEELRRSHLALEVSRDKYLDLYDFAPLGYLTLNDNALITDVNLTGAMLFGAERNEIINHRFEQFIAPEDFERWYQFFANIQRQHVKKQVCTFVFIRENGSTFPAQLEGVRTIRSDGAIEIHIAISDITDIREAEKALRESEEKYRVIFEKSVNGLFKITPDGALIAVNDAFARIYDYSSAAEMTADNQTRENLYIGRSLYANPEDRKEIYRILAEKGKVENFETLHCKRDGTRIWISITARVVCDPEGTILFIEGTVIDITKRKQAEDALRESESFNRGLVENLPDYIIVYRPDGKILYANPATVKGFGYNLNELVGTSVISYVAHECRTRVTAAIATRFKGDDPPEYETVLITKEGQRKTVIAKGTLVRYHDGLATLLLLTDITERKVAEEALQTLNAYNRNLLEASLDSLVTINSEGKIADVNASTEKITGCSREELIGTDFSDYFTEPEQAKRGYQRVFADGTVRNYPLNIRNRDGHITPVLYNATVYRDDKGDITGVFAAARDITERKRTEEALREGEERFRGLIDTITSGVAIYEVRNNGASGKDYIIKDFNKTALEIEGENKEDVIGKSLFDLRPTIDEYGLIQVFQHVWETGVPAYFPQKVYIDEKYSRWYENRVFRLQSGEIVAIYDDITELKQAEEAQRESHDRFEATIASLDEAIFLVDPVTRLISECNDASTRIFGYSREELVGSGTGFLHVDQAHLEQFSREVNATYDDPGYYSREFKMRRKNGEVFPTEHFVRPIHDPNGRILYVVSVVRDITERKKAEQTIQHALAEKEVLLREIHHRVKNNLAGILSLIELQISSMSDPVQIAPFKDLETRIRSIALVHESLSKTKDLARIYFVSYTENLTRYLLPAYGTAGEVKCKIEMGYITLPIETATPCGLVMNEIITNSLKHAFPKTFNCGEIRGEPCTISITLNRDGSDYLLGVSDNGIGMPEGIDVTISHTLGLFLIRFIVEHQLMGVLEISTAGGTAYTIRFPEPKVKERNTNEKM